MAGYYKHIYFDLDETLWDYWSNAEDTVLALFERYEVATGRDVTSKEFVDEFFRTNRELWSQYDRGIILKDQIREKRFPMVMERLGIKNFNHVEAFQDDFIGECPKKKKLVEYASEILEKLKDHYRLHVITNGFEEIQMTKLRYSGLQKYFDQVVTSEKASAQKPDPGIFLFAMKSAGAEPGESLMIGDNLNTDIKGAAYVGMDQVYFNPGKNPHNFEPTHEIKHLKELSQILLNE